nr:MAG: hypothetical protein DIU55_14670 [Bacillota bacterium]
MRRLTRERERALLEALEIHESAGDLALATGLPLRLVIHYQRLYGPANLQLQRAEEDRRRVAQIRRETIEILREQRRKARVQGGARVIARIEEARKERWGR